MEIIIVSIYCFMSCLLFGLLFTAFPGRDWQMHTLMWNILIPALLQEVILKLQKAEQKDGIEERVKFIVQKQ